MVIRMDLLPVQLCQLIQTTTVTLTRTSHQSLIPMVILILNLHLLQRPCIIIHIHTLIRPRLLTYHTQPPIRILHPIRQPIVLILQTRQTCTTLILTRMSRIIHTRTRILRRRSLMYILIHIYRMTFRLRTSPSQCQRAIVVPEDQ